MQLAAARDAECIRAVCIMDAERDICVQLAHQSLADLAGRAVLALAARKRAVVDDEVHRDRRLRDLLERDRLIVARCADRVADLQISDTGDSDNRADIRLLDINLVEAVELIELRDLCLLMDIRVVIVHAHDRLADGD